MKILKVKLKDIVKANNAIEDSPSLSKKLIQNAVNNWTIDSNSDEELNKILTIIAYLSDKYNFDYKVEDEI